MCNIRAYKPHLVYQPKKEKKMKNTCFRQFLGCYLLLLLTHVISFTSKHWKSNIMSSKTIKTKRNWMFVLIHSKYITTLHSANYPTIRAHISSVYSMLVWNKIEIFRYASAFSTPHLMRLTFMLFNKCFKISKFYCTIYTKCLKWALL